MIFLLCGVKHKNKHKTLKFLFGTSQNMVKMKGYEYFCQALNRWAWKTVFSWYSSLHIMKATHVIVRECEQFFILILGAPGGRRGGSSLG